MVAAQVEIVVCPMPRLGATISKLMSLRKGLRGVVDPTAAPHTALALASLEAALDEE